jgi:ribonucleoside-diphosphate reductase alpha chain
MNEQQLSILKQRYFQKGETWSKLCTRVSKAVAKVEKKDVNSWQKRFYDIMYELYFIPNSPTLINAGVTNNSLSACYVLDIDDSLEGIMHTATMVGRVQKFGGGTGVDYSKIRPTCMKVASTGGDACGPIGAIEIVNSASKIFDGGAKRRGANMAILRVDHPDILKFIKCKSVEGELHNVNISVAVTKEFINKRHDDIHVVRYGRELGYLTKSGTYAKHKNQKVMTVGDIVNAIVECMHKNGEPGLVFIDRMNDHNPIKGMKIYSTNPCGEQPLFPYESCNLGSVNIYSLVNTGEFDWDKLDEIVDVAVRFLDNIIDVQEFPVDLTQIQTITKQYRKIGLGIMGFADALYALGIRYGSPESISFAEELMQRVNSRARNMSEQIGKEKGAFSAIKQSKFNVMRNTTVTTIAPTGSIAMIAGVSAGIEPVFKKDSMKVKTTIGDYIISNEAYRKYKNKYDKDIFVEANDVSVIEHIEMQSAFQEFTDNAVSKTINMPNNTTKKDIKEVIGLTFNKYTNIKGITVYRDGSRMIQAIGGDGESRVGYNRSTDVEDGKRYRKELVCGTMYVQIYHSDSGDINEIFATLGKGGSCNYSFLEAINRLISISLQNGVPIELVIKQLKGIMCSNRATESGLQKGGPYLSCADAMARTIQLRYEELNDVKLNIDAKGQIMQACPKCGNVVVFSEGCRKCIACDWGKCGG